MGHHDEDASGGGAAKLDDATIGQNAQRLTVGAGIVLALLALAGTLLNQLPLRFPVLALTLALLVVLTQLATATFGSPNPEALRRRHADRLRMLLNAWPETTVADVSPYLIGVRSPGADVTGTEAEPRYVQRDIDAQLTEAVRSAHLVLVIGPPCAGKSHTAYNALKVCDRTKTAIILVPDDADALEEVLSSPKCVLKPGETYVLWLDDLERYLPGLHLRALDRFIDAEHLKRNGGETPGVAVMVTMREREFLRILDEGGDAAHVLRGLVARAERFVLSSTFSPDERERVIKAYPEAPRGNSFSEVLREHSVQPGHVRVAVQPEPPHQQPWKHPVKMLSESGKTVLSSRGAVVAVILAVALTAGILYSAAQGGWTTPPSLSDRLQTLSTEDEPCGGTGVSPSDVASVRLDVVRVVHRADGCPESDIAEIFAKNDGTLSDKPVASFNVSSRSSFRCLSPDRTDPCHVNVVRGKHVILGNWQDPVTRRWVLVAFYPTSERDTYEPAAVSLTPPPVVTASGSAARSFAKPARVVVRDSRSSREWPIAGSPVSAAVIVPPRADDGAVIVSGYVVGGTPAAPEILARGFKLGHVQGRLLITSVCDGKKGDDLRITVRNEDSIDTALRQRWARVLVAGRSGCRSLYGRS